MSLLGESKSYLEKGGGQFSKNTLIKSIPVHPLGEQTREIEISRTIEARGTSKKEASLQFPILQKAFHQSIPERAKRSSSLAQLPQL